MDHNTYIRLAEKAGSDVVRCDWCGEWKPFNKIKDRRFCTTSICYNCYYNFWHVIREKEVLEALFIWAEKQLKKLDDALKDSGGVQSQEPERLKSRT